MPELMKTKLFLIISLPLLLFMLIGLSFSAQAATPQQGIGQYATPTAEADGRIIYTAQEGDTCTKISLLNNIPIDQLRALNPDLGEDCIVIAGQKLMIGIGGPAAVPTNTPGPSPTPTEPPPTATPFNGTTEICVLLFEDINGNALREESELGLAGGAISVTNALGGYSQTQNSISEIDPVTLEPAPLCFTDLPEGTYTVSAAIPDGYNPTFNLSYSLEVKAGDRASVAFGAQSQEATLEDPADETGGNTSSVLGIIGVILLLGGGGLGWYASRTNKSSAKMRYP